MRAGLFSYGYVATAFLALSFTEPFAVSAQEGTEWPTFRGDPAQTGTTRCTLPDELGVLWSVRTKREIESAPAIAGTAVYVGGMDGILYAFDLATGKEQWRYQARPFKAAPAVRAGSVYIGDLDGDFHCVDAASGKKRWIFEAQGEIHSAANFFGDRVLFGSDDHHLYCLDADGNLAWKIKTKEKIQSSPAVAGDKVLLAGCDQTLRVLDGATGKENALIPLTGHVAAAVAISGDQAFVGTMANQLLALDWKKGLTLWRFEARKNPQPFFASTAVAAELVVAGSRDKTVRAWQRQSGKEQWTFTTKGRINSSPVIAGGKVVVCSVDGHLYLIALASGTEISRLHLGPMFGSPAVAQGRVVVGTMEGEVFCLGAKK